MRAVEAAHQRFGGVNGVGFEDLFAPAIYFAREGVNMTTILSALIQMSNQTAFRTPEGKQLFSKPDGSYYYPGDLFKQPALADLLTNVSKKGADYMYTGPWGQKFVETVQKWGGYIDHKD